MGRGIVTGKNGRSLGSWRGARKWVGGIPNRGAAPARGPGAIPNSQSVKNLGR
jgi:hypothetical protein